MPSLANFDASNSIKALYLGDPGAGKTGSLASLVAAGYKLRIWNFDNLLRPLFHYVEQTCKDKIGNVAYQNFTDKIKAPAMLTTMIGAQLRVMPAHDGTPTAFARGLKALDYWKTETEDLGDPHNWGQDTIVVIDSLSSMSRAAFRYVQAMNPMAKESQTYYGAAQELLRMVLSDLFSEQFKPNVIMIAHLNYTENHLELTKGFPRHIGVAMNTEIGSYFNCIILAESLDGKRRQIRTNSTGIVDLKNPVSFRVPETLPLETGLATFFAAIKGDKK